MASADDFQGWLQGLGLERYAKIFSENDIDFRAASHLSDADLTELGLSLGHRRILMAAIASRSDEAGKSHEARDSDTTASSRVPEAHSAIAAGERRQLTVMFCDLVGSTELARSLDPEDLLDVLRHYRNTVAEAVENYQGHIAQFMGDGVLAYFGWPSAFEDQAERAVRAGLDAIAAVQNLSPGPGLTIQSRVGIETGEVVIDDMLGDAVRDTQSATGETPNRAARLQGIAQPGQLVIGSKTRPLLGTMFDLESLGEQSLKGYTQKEPAWAVLGISSVESRFEAVHGAVLSDLVGREHELGLLRARWDDARSGEGQVVSLSGEGGIGKSRLVREFRAESDKHRNIFYFQCSPHHANSAFYPIIQQTQRTAGISREDTNDQKLDKLEEVLSDHGDNVKYVASLFAPLLSIDGEARYGALEYSPQQLRHRTIEALIDQMVLASKRQPVLVLVEDAHWIDPSMGDFVAEFIPRVAAHRILLLITYRPQNAPPWSVHPNVTAINLSRLGRRQVAGLANAIADTVLPKEVIDGIVMRAEGVPLYVEELTKSVIESAELGDRQVPVSLQSSLVARLDRLGDAKDLAQIGSVVGREFSFNMLAALSERTEEEVANGIESLLQSGLVYRRGIRPNSIYTFKHALIQDAAYGTILLIRRRHLHAMIVRELEGRPDSQSSESIHLLGHHAYQANMPEKAFRYLIEAGAGSMNRAEIHEAVAHYERALHAESDLSKTEKIKEDAIDLRFQLRNALWNIGEFAKILDHLADAEQLAKELDDSKRAGWVAVFRGASYWQLGQANKAVAAASDAVRINEQMNDLSLSVGANFYLGCAHSTSGDYQRAEVHFENIVETVEGELRHDRCGLAFVPSVCARSWLVWLLAERGDFVRGLQLAEEALEIANEIGNPWNLAHIYYDFGYFYAIQGEHQRAVDAQQNAFDLITEFNLTYLAPFIGGFLGHAYALAGRHAEALATLERALQIYETIGLGLFRSLITVHHAEALLLADETEQARSTAQKGLQLAIDRREPGHQCHAHRVLGLLALRSDESDAAIEHFNTVLSLSQQLGMRPFTAHGHLGLAQAARLEGDSASATRSAKQAQDLYSEMNMRHWLDEAASV